LTGRLGSGLAAETFIREQTRIVRLPEPIGLSLQLADEATLIWQATEDALEAHGIAPPFWAFAWAGGQGLARYLLDRPQHVAGRRVLDFACGSGLVAIAAQRAGAGETLAFDIDFLCGTAVRLNAALNSATCRFISSVDPAKDRFDVVLAGDVFYDKAMSDLCLPLLYAFLENGSDVLVGDPGRSYFQPQLFDELARYDILTDPAVEGSAIRSVGVHALRRRRQDGSARRPD
jgi:predicted nicotinamide N-methyase